MIVEVVVATVGLSLTTVVVASLRFARRVLEAETAEAVRRELADRQEAEDERKRNLPPEPPPPPQPPEPPYWRSLATLDALGEQSACPFCQTKLLEGATTWQSRPVYAARGAQAEFDRARLWLKENKHPQTVGGAHTVVTDDGPRLYQCCFRCQAEWLVRVGDVLLRPKTHRPKVPTAAE